MIPRTYRQDANCGRHYQELFTIAIFTGVKEQEVLSVEGYGTITGTSDPLDSVCDEVVIDSVLGRAVSEPPSRGEGRRVLLAASDRGLYVNA